MQVKDLQLKRMTRIVLSVLLQLIVGLANVYAQVFTVEDLNYLINDDGISVTVMGHVDGVSATGSVSIPESVSHEGTSYTVTGIGSNAFLDCINLDLFALPNSLISIGDYAFRGCYMISSITIPSSVTDLGVGAFYGCANLHSVSFNNSLTSIKSYTFYCCSTLWSITIPNSVTSIGNYAFYGCNLLEHLVIPDSVTILGSYSFSYCIALGSVVIGNGVTTIGDHAFYNTGAFGNLGVGPYCTFTIGNSVSTIGEYAFAESSLTSIILPNSMTVIGNRAFQDCHVLTTVNIPNTVITIGNYAFNNCGSLVSIPLPNSVTSIGNDAFGFCTSLTSFTIPSSVNYIGSNVFYGCNSLTTLNYNATNCTMDGGSQFLFYLNSNLINLTIGENVQTIPYQLLHDFPGLQQIVVAEGNTFYDSRNNCNAVIRTSTNELVLGCKNSFIPNTVTSIGSNAFFHRTGLTSIIIPNSVASIGIGAFSDCTGLTSVSIPNSVTAIGNEAFRGCSGLLSITIGSSVTYIGSYAFSNCGNVTSLNYNAINCTIDIPFGGHYWLHKTYLSELNIGENVQVIPDVFVSGQSNLTSLVIPNSVTTIGNSSFSWCSGITFLVIPNSVTSIGNSAFSYCYGLTSVIIPNSVTTIGNDAFFYCSYLTSITIPDSVTTIGNNAFYGCSSLTSIEIPISVTSIGDFAFYGCNGLSEIIMFGTTPPALNRFVNNVFDNTNNCPIYVPYESLNTYTAASNWSNYASRIYPMSYKTIPAYNESNNHWQFIASPLVDSIAPITVDNLITETAYDLYQFSPSDSLGEWQNYKAHTDDFKFVNGQGYLYANENEVSIIFKGIFNEDATKEVSLVYDVNAVSPGWNLVGNPFPCNAYLNREYYVMNEDGTGLNPVAVSETTPIPSCTAVFVKAETDGETVVFARVAP